MTRTIHAIMYTMVSKWYKLKPKAVFLRRKGFSIRKVEKCLKIPRSTLSGWFKNIQLTKKQKGKLYHEWKNALVKARVKAVIWHNAQKQTRLGLAQSQAQETLKNIKLDDSNILDLALAILYLGEGFKKAIGTGMGNSDPAILRFFITALKRIYNVPIKQIKCALHLRSDQNPDKLKKFWSNKLNIPLKNFGATSIDQRTYGSKTYSNYKGVCVITCSNVAIQRKLMYLSNLYCKEVTKKYWGA
ncbi:MAG TPA: hypothetical protein VI978_02275 [Candidatus Paceibacterota bacterium]